MKNMSTFRTTGCVLASILLAAAVVPALAFSTTTTETKRFSTACCSSNNKEWTSDFDDFDDGENDAFSIPLPDFDAVNPDDPDDSLQKSFAKALSSTRDLSGMRQRQFLLGKDVILEGFAGSMGFDQVTDWEYYSQDEDTGERQVVEPPPLDPSKPKRTRERVGSVIRIFRGELTGMLSGMVRSQGLDSRVLVKEFSGDLALDLARAELESIAKLQSALVPKGDDWTKAASARSVMTRQDNAHIAQLLGLLKDEAVCLGILGEINISELEDDLDANEWYRALSVPPPKPNSVWIVYEYAGLSTAQQYCQPALIRRNNMPPKRGVFGNLVPPPPLPKWKERANYMVKGILKGALEAVATLHEQGIAHRSIGRTSILLTSKAMDKTEAASPYATIPSMLRIKLADFGFSGPLKESAMDQDFCRRAKGFGLVLRQEDESLLNATKEFAMAEDLHALGFVFMGLLLTSLAEVPSLEYNMAATDDDTLQRQLGDIFGNDMDEFRNYVEAEEIWSNVVQLLDNHNGAGWEVLKCMCLARERAADPDQELITARKLLESPFFTK